MFDIPCVILAGGKSSRMEEDKCFLSYKNTTLIKYQYDKLSNLFSNVYISAKSDKFGFKCNLILEKSDIFSPLVALQNILKSHKEVFIISVDTPNIEEKSIKQIILNSYNFDISIAQTKDNKTHNLCGVFKNSINYKIDEMIKDNNHKIFYLIRNSKSNIIKNFNNSEFINLNTKEDYYSILKSQ